MPKLVLAAALVAFPSAAHDNGGHVYVGAGASGMHIFPVQGAVAATPTGLGLSLELQLEIERWFLAGSLVLHHPSDRWEVASSSARVGYFFTGSVVAPYLALGAGTISERVLDYDQPPNSWDHNGFALVAEAGVAAPRGSRFGRVALFLQGIEPLFTLPPDDAGARAFRLRSGHMPLLVLGVRLMI